MDVRKKIANSLKIAFFILPASLIINFFTGDVPYLYKEAANIEKITRTLDILFAFSKIWIIPNELYLWMLVFALAGISLAIVWLKADLANKIMRSLASPLTYLYLLVWFASFASLVRLTVVYSDNIDIFLILIYGAYIDGIWKLKSKPFIRKAMLFFAYCFAMVFFLSTRLFPDIGDHGFSPYPFIFGLPALFLYVLSLVVAVFSFYSGQIGLERQKYKDNLGSSEKDIGNLAIAEKP